MLRQAPPPTVEYQYLLALQLLLLAPVAFSALAKATGQDWLWRVQPMASWLRGPRAAQRLAAWLSLLLDATVRNNAAVEKQFGARACPCEWHCGGLFRGARGPRSMCPLRASAPQHAWLSHLRPRGCGSMALGGWRREGRTGHVGPAAEQAAELSQQDGSRCRRRRCCCHVGPGFACSSASRRFHYSTS
jgi:hypothetical protein